MSTATVEPPANHNPGAAAGTNGRAVENPYVNYDRLQEVLTGAALTTGYRPTVPYESIVALGGLDGIPQWMLRRDIPLMITHPVVLSYLNYYKSGIAGAEFDVKSDNTAIATWLTEQCQRFWDRGVPYLQRGYDYGWVGAENKYVEEDGEPMKWDSLVQFSPRDTYLLTQDYAPVGVRVKNIQAKGEVDLWMATTGGDIPAKALWYAHNPIDGSFYGQSQLMGAWRPWRRLAWKDGAETVLDGGVYRLAYMGPFIRYPQEDLQSKDGVPYTTLDSQGRPRRFARDIAREIGEQAKAGASIGLPSTKYHADMGGDYKWTLEWPANVLNVGPIIEYIKNLHDQIGYGIGVPPELLQASETGSGYSGRAIPMEAFLDWQQKIADAMLHLFVEQVLRPLVRWNWGRGVKFEVKVKRLLETKAKARQGQQAGAGAGANAGANGQPGQQPGGNGQQPGTNQPMPTQGANAGGGGMFSHGHFGTHPLVTDGVRNIARYVLRKVA